MPLLESGEVRPSVVVEILTEKGKMRYRKRNTHRDTPKPCLPLPHLPTTGPSRPKVLPPKDTILKRLGFALVPNRL